MSERKLAGRCKRYLSSGGHGGEEEMDEAVTGR